MSIRETNCIIQWIVIYPVGSVIYLLDNWGLMFKEYDPLYIKVDVRTSNLSTAKEKLSRYNP